MTTVSILRDIALVVVLWAVLSFCLIRLTHLRKLWAILVLIGVTLAVPGSFIVTMLTRSIGSNEHRFIWIVITSGLVVLMYLAGCLIVVWIINGVWWLLERHAAKRSAQPARAAVDEPSPLPGQRLTMVRLLTVVSVAVSLITTGYGYVEAQRPSVNPVSLSFANLPANFDGIKIALLSDLHVGATTRNSFLPNLVNQVNAAHPDLIVIAGDVVDGSVAELGPRVSVLDQLSAPYGVIFTTGNHEFYSGAHPWMDYFSQLGFRVLNNDGIGLQRGMQTIQILGINDRMGTGDLAPNLQLASQRANVTAPATDPFRILVAHEPVQDTADNGLAGRLGVDLQLSGHTHGGQLWPFGYLDLLSQPVLDGVHVVDNVTLVTTRGVGEWGPPIRVGADPEITLITLHTS